MKIEIKNIDIAKVISFLEKEDFKGIKSIMRTKLTTKLSQLLEEVVEGEKVIRKDFKDDGDRLDKELGAYFKQTIVIEGGEFLKPLKVIEAHIKHLVSDECDREFKDEAAIVLYALYDAFGLDEDDNEQEGENE